MAIELVHKTYRAESKKDYGREMGKAVGLTVAELTCGATLRIADALEKIANSTSAVLYERDMYIKHTERLKKENRELKRELRKLNKQTNQ